MEPRLDKPVFILCVATVGLISISMLVAPAAAGDFLNDIYLIIANEMGIFYQWLVIASFVFLVWLAMSKHGKHVLGGPDAKSEYSTFSWVGMLFCTGIGAGLLYWTTIEWAYYLESPPFNLEPGSPMAQEWAATYGMFHWGFPAWSLYGLAVVTIAYPYYKYKLPYLRLSVSLVGIFGRKFLDSPGSRFVDLLFILALIGGTGTSLGLGMPMLSSVSAKLFHIDETFTLTMVISGLTVLVFAISVYLGLSKGIRRLSDANMVLAAVFLIWILIFGPALFALELGTSSLGLMFQELIRMVTWTDPIVESGFVEDWSIFYWAWWLAYAPFVGIFVTRISRGRSLRALIIGMLGFGSLGSALYYIVWGNSVMWMDLQGMVAVQELVSNNMASTAIAEAAGSLMGQPIPLVLFLVVAFVFIVTTYDSASYCIASAATRGINPGQHPATWHRVFWAFAISGLPIALVIINELRGVQSVTLIASLPLLVVSVMMMVSLTRSLNAETVDEEVKEFTAHESPEPIKAVEL